MKYSSVAPCLFQAVTLQYKHLLYNILFSSLTKFFALSGSNSLTSGEQASMVNMKLKTVEDKVMPMYEYYCRTCGETFELLEKEKGKNPTCPKCNSPETEKKLSIFGSLAKKGKKVIDECNTSFS